MNNFETGKKKFDLGLSFLLEEKYGEAEIEFLNSLKLVPDRISTIKNLILIYIKTENNNKLSKLLINLKHIKNKTEIVFARAYEYYFDKKYEESINLCNSIINKLDKEFEFETLGLLARCYREKFYFLESLKIYKKSLFKFKKNFITYSKIGYLFLEIGKLKKAKIYFEKSRKLKPNDKINLWNLSFCLLKLKELKNGFVLYENRWAPIISSKKKYQNIKEVKKLDEVKGKNLLIWGEQGLGDNLLFSRFISGLINFTNKITLQVGGNIEIFKSLYPEIDIVDGSKIDTNQFNYQIPICSLPHILGINKLEDLKLNKTNLIQKIKKQNSFKLKKNKLNIGFSFYGNQKSTYAKYRSLPLKYFYELLKNKNLQFYNLSKGARQHHHSDFDFFNIIDLGEKNFLQLAEILKELDLIISIDTALIHLSGTLNLESYLLLNFNSDWRWFNDYENTIWYPNVKIIKQDKFNRWEKVIEKITKIINNKINKKFNERISK